MRRQRGLERNRLEVRAPRGKLGLLKVEAGPLE